MLFHGPLWPILIPLFAVLCTTPSCTSDIPCNGERLVLEPIEGTHPFPNCPNPKPNSPDPYLSIVTATRNDVYGGSPSHYRTQRQVHNVAMLASCYNAHIEHIIVDWNPDPSLAPITELLGCQNYTHVRVITVSSQLHEAALRSTKNDQKKTHKMLEYHAKNVGIRRARGQYILLLNNDILLASSLFEILGSQTLCPDLTYSAIRYDVPKHFNMNAPGMNGRCGAVWETLLQPLAEGFHARQIRKAHIRKLRAGGPVRFAYGNFTLNPAIEPIIRQYGVFSVAPGDFVLAHRDAYFYLQGMPEVFTRGYIDTWLVQALVGRTQGHLLFHTAVVYHQFHESAPYDGRQMHTFEGYRAGRLPEFKPEQPEWGLGTAALPEARLRGPCPRCALDAPPAPSPVPPPSALSPPPAPSLPTDSRTETAGLSRTPAPPPEPVAAPLRSRGPRVGRFAVVTGGRPGDPRGGPELHSKRCYSERHDYAFHALEPGAPRAALLRRLLPQYEWVLWLDPDTVIVNGTIRLEHYVDDPAVTNATQLLLPTNWAAFDGLNSAAFLLRRSTWSARFLADWDAALRRSPGGVYSAEVESGRMVALLSASIAAELDLPPAPVGVCVDPGSPAEAASCLRKRLEAAAVPTPPPTRTVAFWPCAARAGARPRGFLAGSTQCQGPRAHPCRCWQKGDFAVQGPDLGEFDIGFGPAECPAWGPYQHVELGIRGPSGGNGAFCGHWAAHYPFSAVNCYARHNFRFMTLLVGLGSPVPANVTRPVNIDGRQRAVRHVQTWTLHFQHDNHHVRAFHKYGAP